MDIKKYQITLSLIFINLIVYILFNSKYFKICVDNDFLTRLSSNFIHIETLHLLSNIIGLITLSYIEKNIGTFKFIKLICLLVILISIFELFFKNQCSIGFSGVLYGLISYDMITEKKFDI